MACEHRVFLLATAISCSTSRTYITILVNRQSRTGRHFCGLIKRLVNNAEPKEGAELLVICVKVSA